MRNLWKAEARLRALSRTLVEEIEWRRAVWKKVQKKIDLLETKRFKEDEALFQAQEKPKRKRSSRDALAEFNRLIGVKDETP